MGEQTTEYNAVKASTNSEVVAQRQEQWQQVRDKCSRITDRLGQGIDEGVLETVAAFQVLGIHTIQSCEGHLDRGIAAPWIDMGRSDADLYELRQSEVEVANKARESEEAHAPPDQVAILFAEARKLRQAIEGFNVEEPKKLIPYLDLFYKGRDVPYDQRLIIEIRGLGARLQSQGANFQQINQPKVRKQKLSEYHAEMRMFTDFLKQGFLTGSATPVDSI